MKKILIVDDDREWNMLLKMKMGSTGFKTEQAFDGKDAYDKIHREPPDLVLMDVTMPVMDGWELCKALRSEAAFKDLPIMTVASYSPENVENVKAYGVKRYLVKPCSASMIVQNVLDFFLKGA